MRKGMLLLGLVCCAAGAADAPQSPVADSPLDLIQARYAGTWAVDETDYASDFSRAGTKQYEITRDCALAGTALDCKLMAQATLQGEQRFTWDAAAGTYHVDMDIASHPQPPLTLTVKGAAWTFLENPPGPDGKPLQLRIQRQYRSASEVSYSTSYSRDGVSWTVMNRGTEIRKDPAK